MRRYQPNPTWKRRSVGPVTCGGPFNPISRESRLAPIIAFPNEAYGARQLREGNSNELSLRTTLGSWLSAWGSSTILSLGSICYSEPTECGTFKPEDTYRIGNKLIARTPGGPEVERVDLVRLSEGLCVLHWGMFRHLQSPNQHGRLTALAGAGGCSSTSIISTLSNGL